MRLLDTDDYALFQIFKRDYPTIKDEELLRLWDYSRILQLRAGTGQKKKMCYRKIASMLGLQQRQIFRILKWGRENYDEG